MNKTIIAILALLTVLLISGCSGEVQKMDSTYGNDVEWRCSNTQCAEFLNGQDWANANCVQNADQVVCPVVANGQQVLIPIEQINISAVQSCVKFVCTEEMPVKTVDEPYEINVTFQ